MAIESLAGLVDLLYVSFDQLSDLKIAVTLGDLVRQQFPTEHLCQEYLLESVHIATRSALGLLLYAVDHFLSLHENAQVVLCSEHLNFGFPFHDALIDVNHVDLVPMQVNRIYVIFNLS